MPSPRRSTLASTPIGFVFAKSVRQVTPDVAPRLAASARGRARCVAVTRHPTQRDIDEIMAIFKPDVLQTDAADLRLLKLPAQLELLPGVSRTHGRRTAMTLPPARLLFEGVTSGAGVPCDWTAARRVARRTELVLAGGLNSRQRRCRHRSGAAVRRRRIERSRSRPGVKSPVGIANFVRAARDQWRRYEDPV